MAENQRTCAFNDCDKPVKAVGYCGGHYHQLNRGTPLAPLVRQAKHGIPLADRLAFHTDKSGECWLWTAAKDQVSGYGRITIDGRLRSAHRVSYELTYGPIGSGMMVDHICHNGWCIRPDHLRAVTNKQNQENRRGAPSNNTSGARGVRWRAGKWEASVGHNMQSIYLGRFAAFEEAVEAVRAKRLELFTHNDPDRG